MKIKDLKQHPLNKTIFEDLNKRELERLKEDISKDGLQNQLHIKSDGTIICGHMRYKVLKELYGDDYEIPDDKILIRTDIENDENKVTKRLILDNVLNRQLNEIQIGDAVKLLKPIEKKNAEDRLKEAGKKYGKGKPPSTLTEAIEGTGEAYTIIAKTFKKSKNTIKKAEIAADFATKKEKKQAKKTQKMPESLKEKVKKELQKRSREAKKKANEKRKEEYDDSDEDLIVKYKSSEKLEELNNSIGLVVTSPPYWKIKDYGQGEDKWDYSEYLKLMKKVWKECYRTLKPSSKLCINIGDQYMSAKENGKFEVIPIHADFIKQCKDIGFDYYGAIIWQKVSSMNSSGGGTLLGSYPYPKRGILLFDYEFILIFHKPGDSQEVSKEIKESSLITEKEWQTYFSSHWKFVGEKQKDHPAQFPEELPKRLIKMFSFKEEIVLDPFLGSGTTLKVAKKLKRKGIGYEINKEEFEAIINDKLYGEKNG